MNSMTLSVDTSQKRNVEEPSSSTTMISLRLVSGFSTKVKNKKIEILKFLMRLTM
jgi:hypothetical protein